ncbi:hypothetical protein V1511DRAFT_510819 [Dipodascopsis uninucleata]
MELVRSFWFGHIKTADDFILPSEEISMKWFRKDESFDRSCTNKFGECLNIVGTVNPSGAEILEAVNPATPLDWLSVILLLDQLPRNSFRGTEAKYVFKTFDPIALQIALRAIELGIPEKLPIRYRLSYRFWFYLPLEHSESAEMQVLSVTQHTRMIDDVQFLVNNNVSPADRDTRNCRIVLSMKTQDLHRWAETMLNIAKKHKTIIDRFGRYPHRNLILGRKSTDDEEQYLKMGGDTFGY